MPATPARRPLRARLTPIAAALAGLLPSLVAHAAGPVIVPPPAANAVPVKVPGAGWRVYGTGNNAPFNQANAHGGVDQTITQTSQKGIYNWQSFNIGSESSVTFDMALPGASALNRVTGTGPSQIFGKLKATNNGEIYLINANGILFGRGAVVNTGSLIASGLDVTDDNFKASLLPAITSSDAQSTGAFQYTGDPGNFVDSRNYVRVDEGATITTSSGGRVFLFAKKVDNAGTITTPDGQTALAAGSEVFLRLPTDNPGVYASEQNPDIPALRGFLVDVGDAFRSRTDVPADVHVGTVTNAASGVISAPRGNATLVGLAVNQMGRVSATTSVSENGTIFLRAQADATLVIGTTNMAVPNSSGALTLGPASRTEILPDTTLVDGKVPTSDSNATFIGSRIDLQGKTVELQSDASVFAPGATVKVQAFSNGLLGATTPDPDARIAMDDGARIDVSGTTDTVVGVDRYFVGTDLLTSNDLQDAPLQKNGLLYRAKVTVDVREDSKILGDLTRYRDTLQQSVEERLSTGGHVDMAAQGAVLLAKGSSVDVSGGQIRATSAMVDPTLLVASNGALYSLNDAPADQVYAMGLNVQKAGLTQYDRWGALAAPGASTPATLELGYTQGQAAGALSVDAPAVVLAGTLAAHTVVGERQAAGLDPLAGSGSLVIGNPTQYPNANPTRPLLLGDFTIGARPQAPASLWAHPLTDALPEHSGVALGTVVDAGFGDITVAAEGDVTLDAGKGVTLVDHTHVTLETLEGDVLLKGNVTDHAGSIALASTLGHATIAAGSHVDLSGRWINQFVDGVPQDTSSIVGGSFSAQGSQGVTLSAGTLVDVSGGAAVSTSGTLAGGNAGSVALLAGRSSDQDTADDPLSARTLDLLGTVRGEALQSATGGSLTLRAPSLRIGAAAPGAEPAALTLAPDFFTQGGFSSYSVEGLAFVDIAAGTRLAPTRQAWWTADNAWQRAATGSRIAALLQSGQSPFAPPSTVSLAINSGGTRSEHTIGDFSAFDRGEVTFGAGSAVVLVPGSTLAVNAMTRVTLQGRIEDHGGAVSLAVTGAGVPDVASYLWLGKGSVVDVSGTTVLTPSTDGLAHGIAQDGGSISLVAGTGVGDATLGTSLVVQEGARLALDGTRATLDMPTRGPGGSVYTHQGVSTHGGSLDIAGNSDLVLEGTVSMRGGDASAAGGSITATLHDARDYFTFDQPVTPPATPPVFALTQATTHTSATLTPADLPSAIDIGDRNAGGLSNATLSADWVKASGAADLEVNAARTLHVVGNVQLAMPRNLVLDAAALSVDDGSASRLAGGLVVASNRADRSADANHSLIKPPPEVATAGTGRLALVGQDMIIDGDIVTQGTSMLALSSAHDLRLQSGTTTGSLASAGGIAITAGQLYPATGQSFTISAPDHAVTIAGGDAALPKPLSAGGALTIEAGRITQSGVVRAPFGSIALQASDALELAAGSETSVSGAGLTVDYGTTLNGASWLSPYDLVKPITALPAKSLTLTGASVKTDAGAAVDVSGGGNVVAYEFIAGPGGSQNVFADGSGSYALVPGQSGLGGFEPGSVFTGTPTQGQQLVIGEGAPVPAGRYTLMPARFALLPGAFLVKPASGTPLGFGSTITNPDGSSLVGARTASADTPFTSSTSSTWSVQTSEQALTHSEIHITNADAFFAAQAAKNDQAAPRGPADGGVLQIVAGSTDLAGGFNFDAARDTSGNPLGLGGVAAFSADHIVVGSDSTVSAEGTLTLSASQLDAMAPATLLLGATLGTGTTSDTLSVSARDVRFENTDHALSVGDVVAAATDAVTVGAGAAIVAAQRPVTGPAAAPAAPLTVAGDGAALRVSNQAGIAFTRTGVAGSSGSLLVDDHARLDAGAGSLLLDATRSNTVARTATLHADDITLGATRIIVGNASAPDSLNLGDALLGQVGNASHLTLRGYNSLSFRDGAEIAGDRLRSVTLDSGRLLAVDAAATVTAGEITLMNSTGSKVTNPVFGEGRLTFHASALEGSGRVVLGDGTVAVSGVRSTLLQADRGLVLAGAGSLDVGGSLVVRAPRVLAQTPAVGSASVADITLNAPGTVEFLAGGPDQAADTAASAPGAALTVNSARITQGSTIDLPSGQLTLAATASVAGDVFFATGSHTNLAGATRTIDGQALHTGGGTLEASARLGDVTVAPGASVDVSAAGDASGGKAAFTSEAGAVALAGTLLGVATDPTRGAQLIVDAIAAPALDQLAALQQQASGNFDGTLAVRQRGPGDLALSAQKILRADTVAIEADGGALTVAGRIDAGSRSGGSIALAARDDLTLASGGSLSVHATGDVAQGGRIDLTSAQGRLKLLSGADVDLTNDAAARNPDAAGGRLTLRAAQAPDGQDVAIDAVGAHVAGAASVDVQAVKVYDDVQHLSSDDFDLSDGTLHQSDIARDSLAFLGDTGQNADAIAGRLAAGDPKLLEALRIHAEAEVRSTGNLDIKTDGTFLGSDDLVLPTESVDLSSTSAHVGDTSLTLRAAGNIRLARTISAGFDPVFTGSDERVTRFFSEHSGNIRVVAGADLGAASATATRAGHGALSIGRSDQPAVFGSDASNIVAIRATTGNIELAAGGDIDLVGRDLVYTVGVDVTDDTSAQVRDQEFLSDGAFAFTKGAGDVSLNAGGSVTANEVFIDFVSGTRTAEELDSYRHVLHHRGPDFFGDLPVIDGKPTLVDVWTTQVANVTDSQYAQHGVVSYGGGRVDVTAGEDVTGVAALSPSTGYVLTDPDTGVATAHVFAGGNVRVEAGRDVVNGLFESGGQDLTVHAGRDFAFRNLPTLSVTTPGVRLVTENAAIDAAARRDVTFGNVQSAFWTQQAGLTGLDGSGSATVTAAGGNVAYLDAPEYTLSGFSLNVVVPASFSVLAPFGDLTIGRNTEIPGVYQAPGGKSRFDLLAGGSVDMPILAPGQQLPFFTIAAAGYPGAGPTYFDTSDPSAPPTPLTVDAGLDHSDRTPVHIAAAAGDVQIGDISTARPIRISAGNDVTLYGSLEITQQTERLDGASPVPVAETSSIQAGRDILFQKKSSTVFGITRLNGSGDFLMLAGRDIDLGKGSDSVGDVGASGLEALGNSVNAALPPGGTDITLVAGLRADGTDYDQATLTGFEALGANALTDHAGDLYAQLTATRPGPVALGSAAARAFDAQGLDQQLAQVRTLVGGATYDARLAAYVREQPGRSGLTDAQALAAFPALPPDQRAAAPGVLLAPSFALQPQDTRTGLVNEIAAATPAITYDDKLVAYMKARDGQTRTLQQAMIAFEALPQAARIPLLDTVLVSEVRASGRAAAGSTGSVQQAAYDRGYRSISAIFPADRPDGDVDMPEAVVKTLQQGGITVLTPGGGVDAGGVSASTIRPDNLGIVTVAGGDISSIVRDDFSVNRSRVFTLTDGDILIWSSDGNIDAGRGAKTVVGSPPPALRIDQFGHLFLDTSGSFTGSGIAVLDAHSDLDLYAPVGAIDAGEAGIRSVGNAFFAAQTFIGTDNLSVGGQSVGAPPAVSAVGSTAGLANATNVLANAASTASDEEREERRKRRNRRNLLLEFLGFGNASN